MIVRGTEEDGTLSESQIETLKRRLDVVYVSRLFKWVTARLMFQTETEGIVYGGDTWMQPDKIVTVKNCYIASNVDRHDPELIHLIYCDEDTIRFHVLSYDFILGYEEEYDEQRFADGNKKRKCGSRKKKRRSASKKRSRRTSRK